MDRDPEIKCFQPGVPRAMYMPHPFQIIQSATKVMMVFEFANAQRTIHLNKMEDYPNVAYMGYSVGRWEGDTLVVDVNNFTDATWFDRAGNFHSDALHVVERYTPMGKDAIRYEATIDDPQVYTRPWKISMPLYRRLETECAADGFSMRRNGGRNHVWPSAQGTAGQALGRQHDECRHHPKNSAR